MCPSPLILFFLVVSFLEYWFLIYHSLFLYIACFFLSGLLWLYLFVCVCKYISVFVVRKCRRDEASAHVMWFFGTRFIPFMKQLGIWSVRRWIKWYRRFLSRSTWCFPTKCGMISSVRLQRWECVLNLHTASSAHCWDILHVWPWLQLHMQLVYIYFVSTVFALFYICYGCTYINYICWSEAMERNPDWMHTDSSPLSYFLYKKTCLCCCIFSWITVSVLEYIFVVGIKSLLRFGMCELIQTESFDNEQIFMLISYILEHQTFHLWHWDHV